MALRRATVMFVLSLAFCVAVVFGDEEAAAVAPDAEAAAGNLNAATEGEENDDTKKMLKQLTIGMISEVLDERTVLIRDASSKAAKRTIHLRLGNVGAVPRGSLSEADYAEKVNVAKAALQKLVDKQMIWYKAAPEDLQAPSTPGAEPDTVIVDLWTIEGRHIPTELKAKGHLDDAKEYEYELAKDILTAAAEEEKKDSYKKLEEALKESEKAKQDAAKAARAEQEAQEPGEGFGIGGWLGVISLLVIVLGALTNFGRGSNKKVNLNRKKGPLEQFWMKLKGA